MGLLNDLTQTVTAMIKMNDKITSLFEITKEISEDIKHINNRVVRLETLVEIADKQRSAQKRIMVDV
jgi:ferritin-like metal-binding protein YciE